MYAEVIIVACSTIVSKTICSRQPFSASSEEVNQDSLKEVDGRTSLSTPHSWSSRYRHLYLVEPLFPEVPIVHDPCQLHCSLDMSDSCTEQLSLLHPSSPFW